ncbi:IS982 family transposase [Catalinimonas sp. 4WD22]|uniref:IS982 family transposase n=1 Tax=Catalinimonas locisalis TaxID=3133978 RepID=UPI003100D224
MYKPKYEEKLIHMFMLLDDFCKAFRTWQESKQIGILPNGSGRPSKLSASEVLTILIYYHYSGYKCFAYFYKDMVLGGALKSYFPNAVSYNRFVELIPDQLALLYIFLKFCTLSSRRTGTYFADSKKLPVCNNLRIHSNKVFKGIAQRGKSSTGWFYGLKLHLLINEYGEIINFIITPGNIADNNDQALRILLSGCRGRYYADKGYLTKLFEELYEQGLHLITKIRKNMKNKLMLYSDKIKLKQRALIESVNDLLMTVFDIDHTRHRSPINAIAHAFSGLIAYCFYEQKPSVFIKPS